jgi:hypothetical protein
MTLTYNLVKSRYKLDFVGMQEVVWDDGGTESVDIYTCFYGNGNENHEESRDCCSISSISTTRTFLRRSMLK